MSKKYVEVRLCKSENESVKSRYVRHHSHKDQLKEQTKLWND